MAPIISFSGIASGIDSSSLIKALLDRERIGRISPLETSKLAISDTNDSLKELKSLLITLQSAAQKFRTVSGGVLGKRANSSDETVLAASAGNGAQNGSYAITVNSLAKNATISLGSSAFAYTSSDQAINSNINDANPNRTVSITIGQGDQQENIDIELTSATTLNDFVNQFNAGSSKATASVVNIGTSTSADYRIVISSNNTGLSQGEIQVNVGSEITDPDGNPMTNDGALNSSSLSQATDASFSIAGIGADITRSSNTISDVVSGVTFSLNSIGSATISITDDSTSTSANLKSFVDAYNKLYSYIAENDLITQEKNGKDTINIFGPLAKTSLDENVLSSIRAAFSSASISGGLVNTLADLGVTTERDGTLKFDSSVLSSALQKDSSAVRTITEKLGESLASVDGTIAQFVRFNGLLDVALNANTAEITSLVERMASIEESLAQQQSTLTARFSRLEALIGSLNSQQNALLSILPK